jgi:hypothetical protein
MERVLFPRKSKLHESWLMKLKSNNYSMNGLLDHKNIHIQLYWDKSYNNLKDNNYKHSNIKSYKMAYVK